MAVYNAYFKQDGKKFGGHHGTSYGACWAYFQRYIDGWNKDGGNTVCRILTKIREDQQEGAKAFVASEFFQTLTGGKISVVQWGTRQFNGQQVDERCHYPQDMAIIRLDTSLGASRAITALRLLTCFVPNRAFEGVAKEDYKYVPFVYNAKGVDGEAYSDGGVTLYPSTAGSVDDYYEEYKDEEEWDEYGDMYYSDVLEQLAANGGHGTGASISVEMLARIWGRSSEAMENLCSQTNNLLDGGYLKDIEYDGSGYGPTEIITVSAPITDVAKKGETMIRRMSVVDIIEALKTELNK